MPSLGDSTLTWILTLGALLAVWVPFFRALRLCLQAWTATRRVDPAELKRAAGASGRPGEPIAFLMMRVLRKSLKENEGERHPSDFVFDATRQYAVNEYETHYTRVISMYAGLLPPIGFIGTTGGMLVLFLSMHFADSSLELGALAVALTSSIFALVGFAILEGLKIRLYGRLLLSLRDVQALFEEADARRSSGGAPARAAAAAPQPAHAT